MRSKRYQILYIGAFLILCLIPSAGLLLGGREDSAEREGRASMPSLLTEDRQLNLYYPAQAGAWFEENFAWRKELVSLNALVQSGLGVSAQKDVIVGRDGWLYYRETLKDYTHQDQLSDRALYDIAHTAAMTQEYCAFIGADYLFVIVPDKVTLYPEYLPYYYAHKVSNSSNRTRLKEFMEQEGVHYLDLTDPLQEAVKEQKANPEMAGYHLPALYHKTDSHWTNEGAAIGADAILTELGVEHRDYRGAEAEVTKDFEGDLEAMLYPAFPAEEEEVWYDPAPAYGAVPANLLFDLSSSAPTAVIMEHAERNIPATAEAPSILQALPSALTPKDPELSAADARIACETEEANPYFTRVSGTFETAPAAGVRIYADPGDGILYEAMPVFRQSEQEEGFVLYLPAEALPASEDSARQIRVFLSSN